MSLRSPHSHSSARTPEEGTSTMSLPVCVGKKAAEIVSAAPEITSPGTEVMFPSMEIISAGTEVISSGTNATPVGMEMTLSRTNTITASVTESQESFLSFDQGSPIAVDLAALHQARVARAHYAALPTEYLHPPLQEGAQLFCRLAVLFVACVLAGSTAPCLAQFRVYEIRDRTTNEVVAGTWTSDPANPNESWPGAMPPIFAYLQATGYLGFDVIENGTGIAWTLDVSNLAVTSYIFDVSGTDTPPVPLTLQQLCNIGGFDHFNFVQKITGMPNDVFPHIRRGGVELEDLNFPFLDPIDIVPSAASCFSVRANLETPIWIPGPGRPVDYYPYYYNEDILGPLYVGNFTDSTAIVLFDHPRMPDAWLQPPMDGDYISFTSEIVGVYLDESYDENSSWSGVGTVVNWRSNTTYSGGGGISYTYTASPYVAEVPIANGGGITGVQSDVLNFLAQPTDQSTCSGGYAQFSVSAGGEVLYYQWEVLSGAGSWIALSVGPQLLYCGQAGLATVTAFPIGPILDISFNGCSSMTTWQIRCTVYSRSIGVTSNPATLTICVADTDDGSGTGTCDGGVTIDDLLYYLNIFEDGSLAADVDDGSGGGTPDGGVTIDDLLYYLQRFEAGC